MIINAVHEETTPLDLTFGWVFSQSEQEIWDNAISLLNPKTGLPDYYTCSLLIGSLQNHGNGYELGYVFKQRLNDYLRSRS